mmetsp:Transcript_18486/g.45975  ORF Transcript_18486/g.45975 Transcript_18486/m.45975 type:complete len:697 (-) Transcript_18486:14-2104(-)
MLHVFGTLYGTRKVLLLLLLLLRLLLCVLRLVRAIRLLALDGAVDVAHEHERRAEADVAQHEEEAVADGEHVPEEEAGLHEAGHVGARVVVVEAVPVDEQAGGAPAQHGAPPPLVVLHRQLEVRQRDGDERRDDDQDDEHDEQDAVDGVHLVAPHGREDVVQLDVDGAEGQEPRHAHLGQRAAVPRQRRDLARVLCSAARRVELALGVLAGDAAQHREGEGDQRPDDQDHADGAEGQRRRGPVRDGHSVEEGEGDEHGAAEEAPRQQHVAHPVLTAHLPVVVSGDVAGNAAGESVQHDARREQRPAVVRVEHSHQRQHEHEQHHGEELRAGADHRAEQRDVAREAEHVAVDILPPRLLRLLLHLVVARVLNEVVLQHAHQDSGQEPREQQHGDAAVDDAEPVDLQVLGQERVPAVLLHAAVERDVRLLPLHRVAELHVHGVPLRDVHGAQRVGAHVDLDHAVVVVRDVEVHVREQVVPHLRLPRLEDLLDLADEAPDGQVVVVHLEVVVVLHRLAELLQVLGVQLLLAEGLVVAVHAERHVVRRAHHAVALQHLAQVLGLVAHAALGGAEGQVVVLVRLAGVVERADLVGVQRHGLVHLVRVVAGAQHAPPSASHARDEPAERDGALGGAWQASQVEKRGGSGVGDDASASEAPREGEQQHRGAGSARHPDDDDGGGGASCSICVTPGLSCRVRRV